jgi:hypothetical protein
MASYITYANQGATRNQPLSDDLLKRLQYLQDMGLTAQVFSGGQDAEGPNRTGSHRHDHGGSGDVFFYQGDRKLDWSNPDDLPIFRDIVSKGKEAGITGFGAGPGYMQPGSMHIGMGEPAVWGAGGKGDNAPAWLKNAYNNTTDANDPQMVATRTDSASAPSKNPLYNSAQASAAPSSSAPTTAAPEEKSHNGILVQALNKITGSNMQIPDTILGADTDKLAKGFSGLGDFAKALSADTDSLNKQSAQAAARAQAGRSDNPVELTFLDFAAERKKKKGSLSGLGGYFV